MSSRLPVSQPSAFKTPEGEAAYLAAYDDAMRSWPVPFVEVTLHSGFGATHVVVCGPEDAPPLVLLHGYMATSTMWSPNIADFSRDYRVYAVDVMGQPGKSVPGEPIRDRADFVAWVTATLNGLHLDRVALAGMSFGGWLALNYAIAAPGRVRKLVLLSPGGLLPMAREFTLRGMLMVLCPSRFTVKSFMRWLGFNESIDLIHLGLKHFRMPVETARIMPVVFSDRELRSIQMPVLLLYGDHEVICDPAKALDRARRLIPDCKGHLVPGPRHEMCVSHWRIVDGRVLDFLSDGGRNARQNAMWNRLEVDGRGAGLGGGRIRDLGGHGVVPIRTAAARKS